MIALDDFCRESGDNTDEIRYACERAVAEGRRLTSSQRSFIVTGKIELPPYCDLAMATFDCDLASDTAVLIGSETTNVVSADYDLPQIVNANPAKKWLGTGIVASNLIACRISLGRIVDFAIGKHSSAANGRLNAYNTFSVGQFENNKINALCQTRDSASAVNENTYIGGRYYHYSGDPIPGSRHIACRPFDYAIADASWPNNHRFIGSSVEGDNQEYHVEIGGAYNLLDHARWESAAPKVLLKGHASEPMNGYNHFDGGYGLQNVAFTKEGIVQRTMVNGPSGIVMSPSGIPLNLSNGHSGAEPILQGFSANIDPLGKTAAASDWALRLAAAFLAGKRDADSFARMMIDFQNGAVKVGEGNAAPSAGFRHWTADEVQALGAWRFDKTGTASRMKIDGRFVTIDANGFLKVE